MVPPGSAGRNHRDRRGRLRRLVACTLGEMVRREAGPEGEGESIMKFRRLAAAALASAALVAVPVSALADASDHNCAGTDTSAAASPLLGPVVSFIVQLFPTALPTLTHSANCGDNGNGL